VTGAKTQDVHLTVIMHLSLLIFSFTSFCPHALISVIHINLSTSDEYSACLFCTGNGTDLIVPDASYTEIISEWLSYL